MNGCADEYACEYGRLGNSPRPEYAILFDAASRNTMPENGDIVKDIGGLVARQ